MRWTAWTLRGRQRLLEISAGGRWFLAFTVALGIVAIHSGNNVIYLLESLLLSSLLVSGTLSELTLSRLRVRRELGNLHAGLPGTDVFVVENTGRLPLYCIELGEYDGGGRRELSAFLLMLPGRARLRVRSRPLVPERGRHRWSGLVAATSFPFGFARKWRLIEGPGSRIVWPQPQDPGPLRERELSSPRGEPELRAGELVQVEPWQDATRIHWPSSLRSGQLLARPHDHNQLRKELRLELRTPGPEMEQEIRRAAGALIRSTEVLVLAHRTERQRIEGSHKALDALALLPKAERAEGGGA